MWLAVGLLALSATGLTWSHYAGCPLRALLDAAKGHAPELVTALPGGAEQTEGEHAGHAYHGTGHGAASTDPAAFDAVLAVARDAGLGAGWS